MTKNDFLYTGKEMGNIKRIAVSYFAIFLILLVGIFVRVYGITETGINLWDSAYYANIAKTPIFAVKWLLNNATDDVKSFEGLVAYLKSRGCGGNIIKPGHVFLITLSFILFGIKDYAVILVSAVSGIGVIILTFIIGKRMFNKTVGSIAAAVIAVSGQQVIFSRTGWPQMDTVFLFCLAFVFYWAWMHADDVKRKRRFFLVSAIISGATLLFHQSVIIVILALLAATLLRAKNSPGVGITAGLRDCFYFIAVMLAMLACVQLIIMAINFLNPSDGTDFFARNLERVEKGMFGLWGLSTAKILFYPQMFWRLEGALVAILTPISICFVLWRASKTKATSYIMMSFLTAVPLAFWTFNYTTVKAIQVAMPFIAVVIGVFIVEVGTMISDHLNRRLIKAVLPGAMVTIILLSGLFRCYPIVELKWNYRPMVNQTIEYMKINGGQLSAFQNNLWPILKFYLGNKVDVVGSDFKGKLEIRDLRAHSDYRIIDWRQFYPGKTDIDSLLKIERKYKAILELNYLENALPIYNYHRYYDIERIPEIFKKYPETRKIAVYDLRLKKDLSMVNN